MALVIFSVMADPTLEINLISYIVVGLGSCTSLFFIWKIDEVRLTEICSEKVLDLRNQLELQKQGSKETIQSEPTVFSEDDDFHIVRSKKVNAGSYRKLSK